MNMSKEMRRQEVTNGSLTMVEGEKGLIHPVREVRLLLVKQSMLKYEFKPTVYLEDDKLFLSVNENFRQMRPEFFDKLLERIIEDLTAGRLTMKRNPDFIDNFG